MEDNRIGRKLQYMMKHDQKEDWRAIGESVCQNIRKLRTIIIKTQDIAGQSQLHDAVAPMKEAFYETYKINLENKILTEKK